MALLSVVFATVIALTSSKDVSVPSPVSAPAVPEDFDCPMRQLALEFAMEIQPFLASDKLQEIADALNGAEEAVNRSCVTVPSQWEKKKTTPPVWDDLTDDKINLSPSIYVDFNNGNDDNDGLTIKSPVKHLDIAIEIARKMNNEHGEVYKKIILRKGRHYLRKTIEITPQDNNLLITNYNKELVELSGAKKISCDWK